MWFTRLKRVLRAGMSFAVNWPISSGVVDLVGGAEWRRTPADRLTPVDVMRLVLGAVFAVLTGVFAGRAFQQFQRFLQFRSLPKRIEKEEEAE